ncbi:hypothetical protein DEU34_3075 [Microbacterium sp. AG1240]|uniref:hypothetical protein n=1 Tax=Microbacterium sp. AG1240 TaxID=2183992 RepID=UPI000F143D1C|nr:hypothetical protein [Microbacterium sp. AG1240]RKT31138.1 hypothetical protein DEU34_3075 [Microbacterium sp. AG1240]
MTNPAAELASLLTSWRRMPNAKSIYGVRGMDAQTREEWRTQVRAVELLAQVDRALDALESSGRSVGHYRSYYVAWMKAIIVPEYNWAAGNNGTTNLFDEHVIDMLKATADLLTSTEAPVTVTSESKTESLDALDQILEAIRDAPVADPVRRYLFELISSCRTVLNEASTLGSVDLFGRIHELVGMLTLITDSMNENPEASTWVAKVNELARRLVPYYYAGKATSFALDAAANFKALGEG